MKTASVSKIKASLSEYLAKVKRGEELMVTERGKPIAKLVPLRRDTTLLPDHLLELERAGLIKIGSGKFPSGFWKLPRPKDKNDLALKALLREREEE